MVNLKSFFYGLAFCLLITQFSSYGMVATEERQPDLITWLFRTLDSAMNRQADEARARRDGREVKEKREKKGSQEEEKSKS
jgi:hypothetical protein